jgi:hypothetical protein
MSVWAWLLLVSTGLLGVSLLCGFILGAILGKLSGDISELVDMEPWTLAPLTRDASPLVDRHA